jgi:hypothetical protein
LGPGLHWGMQRRMQIRRQPAHQFATIRRAACVAAAEGYVVHPQPRQAAAAASPASPPAAAAAPPPLPAAAAVTAAAPASQQAPEGLAEMRVRARRVAEEAFASAMAATGGAGADWGHEEGEDEPLSGWWVLPLLGRQGRWLLWPLLLCCCPCCYRRLICLILGFLKSH